MKNKAIKILSFVMIVLMVTTALSTVFAAGEVDLLNPDSMKGTSTTTSTKASTLMNQILGIVQVVAMGIAVIMLVVLAIKYISAAPSEKADIKKSMITYIVGAVLLFGATGILQIVKTFTNTMTSGEIK